MKTHILSFIFGICIMLLISASTQNSGLFIVKPAKPTSTVVLYKDAAGSFSWQYYVARGYKITLISEGSGGRGTMVLEKY